MVVRRHGRVDPPQAGFFSKFLEEALESGYFANVPGTVICEPTYSTYRAMHLQVVPIVTLVSRTGVVLHSWLGQLDSEREKEIRLALDTPE
jgi:hypothetical protein